MGKLVEIVKESFKGDRKIPKLTVFHISNWFQKLIDDGELKAFSVEIDKKTILKEDENEKVIKIKKGATLEPTSELEENQCYIIEDSKTKTRYVLEIYVLEIDRRGSGFYNHGTTQDTYHHCIVEKLTKDCDLRKIQKNDNPLLTRKLAVPKNFIIAKLSINYSQIEISPFHGKAYLDSWYASISVKVRKDELPDKLFKRIGRFFIEQIKDTKSD